MMIKMMKAYVKGAKIVVINEILEIANPSINRKIFRHYSHLTGRWHFCIMVKPAY